MCRGWLMWLVGESGLVAGGLDWASRPGGRRPSAALEMDHQGAPGALARPQSSGPPASARPRSPAPAATAGPPGRVPRQRELHRHQARAGLPGGPGRNPRHQPPAPPVRHRQHQLKLRHHPPQENPRPRPQQEPATDTPETHVDPERCQGRAQANRSHIQRTSRLSCRLAALVSAGPREELLHRPAGAVAVASGSPKPSFQRSLTIPPVHRQPRPGIIRATTVARGRGTGPRSLIGISWLAGGSGGDTLPGA